MANNILKSFIETGNNVISTQVADPFPVFVYEKNKLSTLQILALAKQARLLKKRNACAEVNALKMQMETLQQQIAALKKCCCKDKDTSPIKQSYSNYHYAYAYYGSYFNGSGSIGIGEDYLNLYKMICSIAADGYSENYQYYHVFANGQLIAYYTDARGPVITALNRLSPYDIEIEVHGALKFNAKPQYVILEDGIDTTGNWALIPNADETIFKNSKSFPLSTLVPNIEVVFNNTV